jgi:protein-arginine kinase activator protein McsA
MMSERAWRNEGRMAGEASRIPVVRFTDEEMWAEYRRIQRHLIAQGQPLFRKDVPEATARMIFVQRLAEERNCDQCGETFIPHLSKHRFCSAECRRESQRVTERREKVCPVCGVVFDATTPNRRYCAEACKRAAWNVTMRKRREVV